MKKENTLFIIQQTEKGHDLPITDGDLDRLRSAQRHIEEVASQIPPLSQEQIHALVSSGRLPQFQLRRQADRYLLILAILLLALAASIMCHTAPAGITPLNVTVLILAVADAWVALRAACSLWLMWQTLRLRHRPYRMSCYADRLSRLSRHRRRWLGFVLRNSYATTSDHQSHRMDFLTPRIPSYAIAACLFLLIALNTDKAFATTRNYVKITTTSDKSDMAICDNVNKCLDQL